MARLPQLRLITDPHANSGSWNMAVDAVLLQSALDCGIATLRWYRWQEPTVSLGYFQRDHEIADDPRLADLPRVRRLSGGGTLVHDCEWTYSLALPPSQRVVDNPVRLYGLVHQAFVDELRNCGLKVGFRGATIRTTNEPVLCFARQDENDLVLDGHKILGSAQRRRRGAILQHGGLLLKASAVIPELPGISDLDPLADLSGLRESVGIRLQEEIAESGHADSLTAAESAAAGEIERMAAPTDPEKMNVAK